MRTLKLLRAATAGLLFTAIPLATTDAVSTPPPVSVSPTPSATPSNTQRLAALKAKGAAEISRRITNLNSALGKLQASKTLKATDKQTLVSQVQAELNGLAALNTKLAADTDLTTARADVQSIYTDYRVYYLMLPKTRLVSAADSFDVVEGKLTDLAAKLQARITAAKNAGQNVAAAQADLNDLTSKNQAAASISTGMIPGLLALQPSDYNSNHQVLTSYRQQLATAKTDLTAAVIDAKEIVAILKALPTPSQPPTTSPTPTPKS
jgi:hypothetical protein